MILSVRNERDFNLSMQLDIDYKRECIGIIVQAWDKKAGDLQTKTFPASQFSAALEYYRQTEKSMFGNVYR